MKRHSAWEIECNYCGANYIVSEDFFLEGGTCFGCDSRNIDCELGVWVREDDYITSADMEITQQTLKKLLGM